MADFVAVLRKTIGSLSDNTPEMREKVFDKARATIEARLKAIEPPPPAALVERQRKALEDAINTLRADYAEPEIPEAIAPEDDPLENVFAALDGKSEGFEQPALPAQPEETFQQTQSGQPQAEPENVAYEPAGTPDQPISMPIAPEVSAIAGSDPVFDDAPGNFMPQHPAASNDIETGNIKRSPHRPSTPVSPSRGRLAGIIIAIILLLAAVGLYIWWSGSTDTPAVPAPAVSDGSTSPEEAATTAEDLAQEQQEQQEQPAISAGADKFTQRLLPDGSEVDDGPAGDKPGIGEGSSVATAAQPEERIQTPPLPEEQQAALDTQEDDPVSAETAEQQPAPAKNESQPASQAAGVAVGQRAVFYEERTSTSEGSAEMGTIAWSVVQESPGGDLPPEPAIRAEATIPGKDVQLRMTIRRNGDQTLPASHIVEMIFLTPDGFEGGGVASVSRIAFKETEQAPGSPLIGIPAKIADGFFLIALSDAPAETQTNLNLLRRQHWVDIPITYQSGQRALLSLEKGIPGERVFQEALRSWTGSDSD